jgi:hypothetical protein
LLDRPKPTEGCSANGRRRRIIALGLIWFSKYLMHSVKEMEDFKYLNRWHIAFSRL